MTRRSSTSNDQPVKLTADVADVNIAVLTRVAGLTLTQRLTSQRLEVVLRYLGDTLHAAVRPSVPVAASASPVVLTVVELCVAELTGFRAVVGSEATRTSGLG